MKRCEACHGSGIIAWLDEPTNDERVVQQVPDPCSECKGTGKVPHDHVYSKPSDLDEHRDFDESKPYEVDEEPFEGIGSADPELVEEGQ